MTHHRGDPMTNPPELLSHADREALRDIGLSIWDHCQTFEGLHAVVELIVRARMAEGWEVGVTFQQERSKADPTAYSHNPYRDEEPSA